MRTFIALITLVLATTACGAGESIANPTAGPGPDGDWVLVAGINTVANYPITMSIRGAEVSGRAACNSYFASAVVNGPAFSIGEIGMTSMGCEPAVQEAETAFITMLGLVESFDHAEGGLVLLSPQGDLVFDEVVPIPTADLVGTTWLLETLIEGEAASSVAGDPATLLLGEEGLLTASTGCRSLTGRWIETGGVIVVPELSADGECPDELWKQDSLVVTVVGDEFRAAVDGDTLTLTSMGGDGLIYRAAG